MNCFWPLIERGHKANVLFMRQLSQCEMASLLGGKEINLAQVQWRVFYKTNTHVICTYCTQVLPCACGNACTVYIYNCKYAHC